MLLAFDIGNTNIVVGLFENNKLMQQWRLISDVKKSANDYAVDIIECFLTQKVDCLKVDGIVIASVVPTLTGTINSAIKKFLSDEITKKTFIISENKNRLNIDIKINNKKEIGDDRLINAIAAYKKFGGNLIIVDLGTATTFDVVGASGEYLGGAIAPGINLSLKALHDMTAQLPRISIKKQQNVIGKNTVEAMNSGIYFGYISLLEGMLAKIENELGHKTTRIITGGLAEIFKDALKNSINHHEPDLTLEGLNMVYQQQE